MFRFLSSGVILLVVASAATAGERYIEVWNPPEARGGVSRMKPARKQSIHHHAVPRAVKFRARPSPASVPKVMAKQGKTPDELRTTEPDVTDIPRQITPEGNILRVDSRHTSVGVAR